jgi:chemotaxis family two-component system response regulator Rcp1
MVARSRGIRLMIVEDNPDDARLIREGLREVASKPQLEHFEDAESAWTALSAGLKGPAGLPDLLLLDLNLPGTSGHELLERLRATPVLSQIPVVVLTSSQRQADIERARSARASAYFAKPLTMDGYVTLARDLVEFWLDGRPLR